MAFLHQWSAYHVVVASSDRMAVVAGVDAVDRNGDFRIEIAGVVAEIVGLVDGIGVLQTLIGVLESNIVDRNLENIVSSVLASRLARIVGVESHGIDDGFGLRQE